MAGLNPMKLGYCASLAVVAFVLLVLAPTGFGAGSDGSPAKVRESKEKRSQGRGPRYVFVSTGSSYKGK